MAEKVISLGVETFSLWHVKTLFRLLSPRLASPGRDQTCWGWSFMHLIPVTEGSIHSESLASMLLIPAMGPWSPLRGLESLACYFKAFCLTAAENCLWINHNDSVHVERKWFSGGHEMWPWVRWMSSQLLIQHMTVSLVVFCQQCWNSPHKCQFAKVKACRFNSRSHSARDLIWLYWLLLCLWVRCLWTMKVQIVTYVIHSPRFLCKNCKMIHHMQANTCQCSNGDMSPSWRFMSWGGCGGKTQ